MKKLGYKSTLPMKLALSTDNHWEESLVRTAIAKTTSNSSANSKLANRKRNKRREKLRSKET